MQTKQLIVPVIGWLVMELAIIWALGIAPPDREQGDVQRIFYFHLGSIWPGFLAFFYVMIASVGYLYSRDLKWDRSALASGAVGLAFSTIVLVTGPIWAKPTWGVWWAWDARLTSMLVLWLTFLGYVMLGDYIEEEQKCARLRAVLGIIGASMVPFVYFSTRIFETQHPKPVIAGDAESGINDPQMQVALILALLAFTFLFFILRRRTIALFAVDANMKRIKTRLTLLEEEL